MSWRWWVADSEWSWMVDGGLLVVAGFCGSYRCSPRYLQGATAAAQPLAAPTNESVINERWRAMLDWGLRLRWPETMPPPMGGRGSSRPGFDAWRVAASCSGCISVYGSDDDDDKARVRLGAWWEHGRARSMGWDTRGDLV